MKTKALKTILVILLLAPVISPQNVDKIIQLTPEYGDTIDADEMREIGLINLNNFKGFQHLVFYNRDDKFLVTKITSKNDYGELKDSTIISNLQTLDNIRFGLKRKELAYLDALNSGKSIDVLTTDGQIYTGVIVNVDDYSLMLISRKSLIESDPEYNRIEKRYFEKPILSSVFIKGESKIISNILIFTLSGFVLGSVIGLASGDDTEGWFRFTAGQKALFAGVSLGVSGAILGLITGAAASSSDENIIITDDYDLTELRKYMAN